MLQSCSLVMTLSEVTEITFDLSKLAPVVHEVLLLKQAEKENQRDNLLIYVHLENKLLLVWCVLC